MQKVEIDWARLANENEIWNEIVERSGHPAWHGRNFDALDDSWVKGGLDNFGPPYDFVFKNCDQIRDELQSVASAVMETAQESVRENGGTINCV